MRKKYNTTKFNFNFLNKFDTAKEEEIYLGIVEITNFVELQSDLSDEDLDFMYSKISETIINNMEKSEQVYKSDKDEYVLAIFAKDEKQANHKLNYIANLLSQITQNSHKPEIIIGACNCYIENNSNLYEAQKIARNALELASKDKKVVIKNA